MELTSVNISGFRNIRQQKIDFSPITSLIAENSYGKSNYLFALRFAFDFIHADSKQKEIMMSYVPGIPINNKTAKDNFKVDLFFNTDFHNVPIEVNYSFSFAWEKDDKSGQKIMGEVLRIREYGAKRWKTLISRTEKEAKYCSSETGRCSKKAAVSSSELVLNHLYILPDLYFSEIFKKLLDDEIYIDDAIEVRDNYSSKIIHPKRNESFSLLEYRSIPETVYRLKKQHPREYDRLIDAFMQLFPSIEEITPVEYKLNLSTNAENLNGLVEETDRPFTISDKLYRLFVKDTHLNQPLDFRMLSDGTKRVFFALTKAVISGLLHIKVMGLEEPENCVHPKLLYAFLDLLNQLSGEECKILLTSHSPVLVQYLDLSSIYVGLPNSDGLAHFQKMSPRGQKEFEDSSALLNESTGDYLFDLLSGDEDDQETLEGFFYG